MTGLGETNFDADLIVWEVDYSTDNYELSAGFDDLNRIKNIILDYLKKKGVQDQNIILNAVNSTKNTTPVYSDNGSIIASNFKGYNLSQNIKIESTEVEKIEKISREITELLNQGIRLYSIPPRYYYTKLGDLKVNLIAKATEDAKKRAETIAQNSGSSLGQLKKAEMGVFQITGQNSNEDYSWGGTFNTADKKKTASITIKLSYEID